MGSLFPAAPWPFHRKIRPLMSPRKETRPTRVHPIYIRPSPMAIGGSFFKYFLEFSPPILEEMIQFDDDIFLGGGLKHFLFTPLPGEMIQFENIFFKGVGSTTN